MPEIGRFIQSDPIKFRSGDANFYAYAINEPITFIDPWGLKIKGRFTYNNEPLPILERDDLTKITTPSKSVYDFLGMLGFSDNEISEKFDRIYHFLMDWNNFADHNNKEGLCVFDTEIDGAISLNFSGEPWDEYEVSLMLEIYFRVPGIDQ